MKLLVSFFALMASCVGLQSCDDDKPINPNELPTVAESYIDTHFADASITSVLKEYDDLTYTYKVYLSDGTFIEFKKDGEWKDIENRVTGVPASVIPEKIATYITTNYASNFVVDIERDRNYDVVLNNNLDLVFSLSGDSLRIDY